MEKLDSTVQDARALLRTAKKYEADGTGDGISDTMITLLAGTIEKAVASDTAQRNAIKDLAKLTDAQNKVLDKAKLLIRKQQLAAKGCYGNRDKLMMEEFRVGERMEKTVKAMLSNLAYMKNVAEKRAGDIVNNGFKAADLAALTATISDLQQADAVQELAKKAQVNATKARDKAVSALKQAIQKTRSTAKSVFIGQKAILNEFSTIKRARPRKKAAAEA